MTADRRASAAPTRARPRRARLTRRESQAATRAHVLAAAAEVFAEKGFRTATIADVAERAGYTIGAVYSNFDGKDALFRALMSERLARVEADLAAAFAYEPAADTQPLTIRQRIERDLDRLAGAEDAVPPGWWRLLNEYRAHVGNEPGARADLAALDRGCRDIIARYLERFAASIGMELPVPATELVELTTALTDGLRLAHAEGRASMTSGQGLRLVVGAIIDSAIRRSVPGI